MPTEAASALYEGALSLLVSHFLAGSAAKQAFFSAVAGTLRADAPLLVADLFLSDLEPATSVSFRDNWARIAGALPHEIEQMSVRMSRDFHPIDEACLTRLAAQAGLTAPTRVFQALDYRAFILRKARTTREIDGGA